MNEIRQESEAFDRQQVFPVIDLVPVGRQDKGSKFYKNGNPIMGK